MRRIPVLAAFLALAVPVAALGQDPVPGTARFAVAERGTAVVVPSTGSLITEYLPHTSERRAFTVFARTRARAGSGVLVKHGPVGRRCAASFATHRGTALRVLVRASEPGGYLTAVSAERPWRAAGKRRFCVWLTRNPGERVRPSSSVIEFMGPAIGAAQWALRRPEGVGVVTHLVANRPYTYASGRVGCPGDLPITERDQTRPDRGGLFRYVSFTFFDERCDIRVQLTATTTGLPGIAVSLSGGEAAAGGISHAGDCVFLDSATRPQDARALVERQGCRVGRVIRARSGSTLDGPGDVWAFTVNGAEAQLVPRGTRVDLVLNRP